MAVGQNRLQVDKREHQPREPPLALEGWGLHARSFGLVLSAMVVTSCAAAPAPPAIVTPTPEVAAAVRSDPGVEASIGQDPSGSVDAALGPLIAEARSDLASRLDLAPERITLLEARTVVWPDASLGCPRPGMAYRQVPEDGVVIRFEVAGVSYEYHGGGSRGLFLCERETSAPQSTFPTIDESPSPTPSRTD